MVAITAPVMQATECLLTPAAARAQALGYPTTLQGCTPEENDYWREPGLPFWTPESMNNPLANYGGMLLKPFLAYVTGNSMAPRFPHNCGVCVTPVVEKKNLIVGRVYTYHARNQKSGEFEMAIGRLIKVEDNYLEVIADNHPLSAIWPLQKEVGKEVWGIYEVVYYASYPIL